MYPGAGLISGLRRLGDNGELGVGMFMRVRDVARDVVAEVAPEELPLFDALSRFDDATVVRRLRRRRRRREPLGFGAEEIEAVVTPIVWIVVNGAAQQIGGTAGGALAGGMKSLLRKILRRHPAPVSIPPLTSAQLSEVRQQIVEKSMRRGLSASRAEGIADAVVAALAVPDSGVSRGPGKLAGEVGTGAAAQGS
jgi:hypothetical protein